MRFLLGLLLGAAVVLLVAEGVTGQEWRQRAGAAADRVLALLGDMGRPTQPAQVSGVGPVPVVPPTQPADIVAGVDEEEDELASSGGAAPEPAVVVPSVSEPAGQPIPRPPDPDVAKAPAGAERLQPADAATVSAPAQPDQSTASAREDSAALTLAAAGAVIGSPRDGVAADSHAVWVPFRSRISARGFAERLSDSLGHPFRVERQGPGRYQVVFSYADERERRALLAQASEATGLPL